MKLAVGTSRALDLRTGQEFGPLHHQVVILADNGHIYFDDNVGTTPAGHGDNETMSHAHPEPAGVVDIAVSNAGLFALDNAGRVHMFVRGGPGRANTWAKDKDAKDVVGIGSDRYGSIWVLNRKGEVHRARQAPEAGGISDWERVSEVTTAGFWSNTWSYTVKSKDGLYQIIRDNYGVDDTSSLKRISDEIVRLNKLGNADQISAGQVLVMPAKTYR